MLVSNRTTKAGRGKGRVGLVSGAAAMAVLVAALVIVMVAGGDSDEKELERLLKHAIASVAAEDVHACLALLHESYKDSLGNDYETVRARAAQGFGELSDIAVRTRALDIEVERGVATLSFEMKFTAKVRDSIGRDLPVAGVVSVQNPIGATWESAAVRCIKRRDTWLITQLAIHPLQR